MGGHGEMIRTEDIPGWMSPAELDVLRGVAAQLQPFSTWVEIGVFCGRSAHAVGLALPKNSCLHLVDPFSNDYLFDTARATSYDGFHPREARSKCLEMILDLKERRQDVSVFLMETTSAIAAQSFVRREADIVFIDADHSKPGVLLDCELWEDRAKVLMGHDYDPVNNPEVIEALTEKYPHRISVYPGTTIWRLN
jgi:predicted O-methyltransferase YrrM